MSHFISRLGSPKIIHKSESSATGRGLQFDLVGSLDPKSFGDIIRRHRQDTSSGVKVDPFNGFEQLHVSCARF